MKHYDTYATVPDNKLHFSLRQPVESKVDNRQFPSYSERPEFIG